MAFHEAFSFAKEISFNREEKREWDRPVCDAFLCFKRSSFHFVFSLPLSFCFAPWSRNFKLFPMRIEFFFKEWMSEPLRLLIIVLIPMKGRRLENFKTRLNSYCLIGVLVDFSDLRTRVLISFSTGLWNEWTSFHKIKEDWKLGKIKRIEEVQTIEEAWTGGKAQRMIEEDSKLKGAKRRDWAQSMKIHKSGGKT